MIKSVFRGLWLVIAVLLVATWMPQSIQARTFAECYEVSPSSCQSAPCLEASHTDQCLAYTCTICRGSGRCKHCFTRGECENCYGSGTVINSYTSGEQRCTYCNGSGRCGFCSGTGACKYCGGRGQK